MQKVFFSNFVKLASHQSCPVAGNQLSVRKHAVLTTFRAARSEENIKSKIDCNIFFELFWLSAPEWKSAKSWD
jgi:hypothetical protein